MYILGISCFYHDAAAALLEDGHVIAAAEEERFTRTRGDLSFPQHAIDFCLRNMRLNLDTTGELLTFLVARQNFVLLLLVLVLLVFGGLLIVAQTSVVGPFFYTLF